jgi:hypothetical protein
MFPSIALLNRKEIINTVQFNLSIESRSRFSTAENPSLTLRRKELNLIRLQAIFDDILALLSEKYNYTTEYITKHQTHIGAFK